MVFITALRVLTLQSVKARVPSIKFRKGCSPTPVASSSAPSAQGSRTGRGATTSIIQNELPARFQRQPLTQEEIDYINRGGPA